MTDLTSSDDVVDALVALFAPGASAGAVTALKATFAEWDYLPSVGQRVVARLDNFVDIFTTPADGGTDSQGTVMILNSAGQLIPVKSYPALRAGLQKGDPGKSMLIGSGPPAGTLGYVDDSYYDRTNLKLYTKTSGGWGTGVDLLGAAGAAATLDIGSLTLTAHGTAATVHNSGTTHAAILDITLPAPLDGTTPAIDHVEITTLSPTASPTASFTGPITALVLHLGIPQGPAGTSGTGTGNVNTSGGVTAGHIAVYGADGTVIHDGGAAPFSGAYGDLSGTPILGSAAAKAAGTGAGQVLQLESDGSGGARVPATVGLGAKAVGSDIVAGTSASLYATAKAIADAPAFVALTDAATIAVDFGTFINASVTLGGNRTLAAPTNMKDGQSGLIEVAQDATGSRLLSYASPWKFPGGAPTLSTGPGAIDVIAYVIRGSVIRANLLKAFA